jgi:hypothetical protein
MSTTPYADRTYGNTYFSERINATAWDNASTANQDKALKTATKAMDRLNFAGEKHDPAQTYQFPRGSDTVVPTDIKDACCELALALLDGADPSIEIENIAAVSQGLSDARTTYDRSFAAPHILAGIPSVQAWHLLLPYLRDPNEVRLIRDSYSSG